MKYVLIGALKGILPFLIILSMTACQGILVGNIKSHDATPAVFNKKGSSRQMMTTDSLDCQDRALAADSGYDTYASSAGYTEEQVSYYNQCMVNKGYHRTN